MASYKIDLFSFHALILQDIVNWRVDKVVKECEIKPVIHRKFIINILFLGIVYPKICLIAIRSYTHP